MDIKCVHHDGVAMQLIFRENLEGLRRVCVRPISKKEFRTVSIEEVELELIARSEKNKLVDKQGRRIE